MAPLALAFALRLAAISEAAPCATWGPPEPLPEVGFGPIREASGLAASEADPARWFTINDSGGEATIYAFTTEGRYEGESPVAGAINRDWEALSAGPCTLGAGRCFYVADIGDNRRQRGDVRVTMVPEPVPGASVGVRALWTLRYGDGEAHDAEALLVHPVSAALLILTKSEDGLAGLWSLPRQPGEGTLTRVGTLDLSARPTWQRRVTDAAWSPGGDTVAIRTYGPLLLFTPDPCVGQAWWEASPMELRTGHLAQAEAVAWAADGALLTVSEGRPMPMVRLRCAVPAPPPACDRPAARPGSETGRW